MGSPKQLLHFESNALEQELVKRVTEKGLMVKCVENAAGCQWEGPLHELPNHAQSVCDFFFVSCPNDCGEQRVLYKKLYEHRKLSCSLERIPCKYAQDGCSFQCARKDMAAHEVTERTAHLELVEASKEKYRAGFTELCEFLTKGKFITFGCMCYLSFSETFCCEVLTNCQKFERVIMNIA